MTDRERIVQLEQDYRELLEKFLAAQRAISSLQDAVIQLQNIQLGKP